MPNKKVLLTFDKEFYNEIVKAQENRNYKISFTAFVHILLAEGLKLIINPFEKEAEQVQKIDRQKHALITLLKIINDNKGINQTNLLNVAKEYKLNKNRALRTIKLANTNGYILVNKTNFKNASVYEISKKGLDFLTINE